MAARGRRGINLDQAAGGGPGPGERIANTGRRHALDGQLRMSEATGCAYRSGEGHGYRAEIHYPRPVRNCGDSLVTVRATNSLGMEEPTWRRHVAEPVENQDIRSGHRGLLSEALSWRERRVQYIRHPWAGGASSLRSCPTDPPACHRKARIII